MLVAEGAFGRIGCETKTEKNACSNKYTNVFKIVYSKLLDQKCSSVTHQLIDGSK